jgi:alkyldihydroxyacetonephosphate synthase
MDALTHDLAHLLGRETVSDDPADQSAYAHDLWPRQLIATRAGAARPAGPRAVVWPTETEQLARLVTFARARGVRLAPYGAGSAVTGALALERDVVAVDLKRMRRIHALDLARGVMVADAGILGEHLEEQLQRRGATLGHFPSSIYCSTLGGWIATRGAGQCSGRYGKIEDMVLALEGVLGSGEAFACGPPREGEIDPRALLVGSEGLYGFLTRATMRVWPAPVARRFLSFTFRTLEQAWTAIRVIYQAGLRPAVARLYDPFDTYLFKTGGRAHVHRKESAGTRRPLQEFVLRRVLRHVSLLNRVNERFGEKLFGRSLLVLVFEGVAGEDLDAPAARARALALAQGGRDEGEAPARRWLARRHKVSYRQPPTFARGLWVDTMEVAAPWSRLGELFHAVHRALGESGFVMAHMSHAYPDGCSIYFTFAGGSPDDRDALACYGATWARALSAAHHAGGTISHHHGVGRSKRGAMRLELGAGVDVIDALARAADPGGVMMRGALVPPPGEGPTSDAVDSVPREAVMLDPVSRLATLAAGAPLADVHRTLAARGFTLPHAPAEGTVAAWLARGAPQPVLADPVDHVVAGYVAQLPSGAIARLLPAPRRAAGPDLFPLFACGGGRFGTLHAVTVRVRGGDETGPAWTSPVYYEPVPLDPAVRAWLDRVKLRCTPARG